MILVTCSVTVQRDRTYFETQTTNYSEPPQWHIHIVVCRAFHSSLRDYSSLISRSLFFNLSGVLMFSSFFCLLPSSQYLIFISIRNIPSSSSITMLTKKRIDKVSIVVVGITLGKSIVQTEAIVNGMTQSKFHHTRLCQIKRRPSL